MLKTIKTILIAVIVFSLLSSATLGVNAQAGYAYAFGGEFYLPANGYDYEDIKQAAYYGKVLNYRSYYNGDLTYSYLNSQKLNSDIIYFSCHGDANSLYFYQSGLTIKRNQGNTTNMINLSNWTLSNTKLMIADACSAAAGVDNICRTAWNQGANCALGWITTISTDSIHWLKRFYEYLYRGKTIQQAINYADSFNDYPASANLKSHFAYGDTSQIIKKSAKSIGTEETDIRAHTIPAIRWDSEYKNYDVLEKALLSEFPDFDLDQYQITVSNTSKDGANFVVDFNRIVNGCWTPTGYTIIFENNEATVIYDNRATEISDVETAKSSAPVVSKTIIITANTNAAKQIPSGNAVISQWGELCYLPQSGGYCYRVYTSFGPNNTTYSRTMVFDYPLIQTSGG